MTTEVFDCIVCGQTNPYGVRWCEKCHKEYTYLPRGLYRLVGALAGAVLYLALGDPQFPGLEATLMLLGSAAIGSGLFSLFAPELPALKSTGADIIFSSGEVVETYELESDNSRNAPQDVERSAVSDDPLVSSTDANELNGNAAASDTDFGPQLNAYKFIIAFSLLLLIGALIFMYFDIGRRADNVAVVLERDANLRDGPSTSGTAVVEKATAGTLLNGRWIEATAPQSGRWLEIVRAGKRLYVWEGNLAPQQSAMTSEADQADVEFDNLNENAIKVGRECYVNNVQSACPEFDRLFAKVAAERSSKRKFCKLEVTAYVSASVPCEYQQKYLNVFSGGNFGDAS